MSLTPHEKRMAVLTSVLMMMFDLCVQHEAEETGINIYYADQRRQMHKWPKRLRMMDEAFDRSKQIADLYGTAPLDDDDLNRATRIVDDMEMRLVRYFDPDTPLDTFFSYLNNEAWALAHRHQGEV